RPAGAAHPAAAVRCATDHAAGAHARRRRISRGHVSGGAPDRDRALVSADLSAADSPVSAGGQRREQADMKSACSRLSTKWTALPPAPSPSEGVTILFASLACSPPRYRG